MSSSLCAIALGSNLGDSCQIVQAAIAHLASLPEIKIVRVSRWYCTKAITLEAGTVQPDYINGCAILAVKLTPSALLAMLLATEIQFGRERRERWGARTLDLDLLLYEDYVVDTPSLTIPHPRMGDRAFVLLPLAEIAPDWVHPISGCTISKLALNPPDLEQCLPKAMG
jgi:2-amino-4-hydroxy-6-hydroxymethyldihydropteridine diphosphokinase